MLKKAALGFTTLLTITTAAACSQTGDDGDQGAMNDRNMRGVGLYQERSGDSYNSNRMQDVGDGVGTGNRMFGLDTDNRDNKRKLYQQSRAPYQRGNEGGFLNGGVAPRMNDGMTEDQTPGRQRTDQYDAEQARALKQRVLSIPGVRDANIIVHGNDVICGVETNGSQGDVMERVRKVCQEEMQGARVHVTDDEEMFRRVGDMDGRLQQGNMRDAVVEFQSLLRDLGRNEAGNQRS